MRPPRFPSNLLMMRAVILCLVLLINFGPGSSVSLAASRNSKRASYEKDIQPVFTRYCDSCHGEKVKGDLNLRIYTNSMSVTENREVFEKVIKALQAHEMPPEKKPQPTTEERQLVTSFIEGAIYNIDCDKPDPGRVTIRRLNRVEYNNTVRDLIGVTFRPADDFPADDVGYGFDNIGDVLSMPPVLLEKYMAAAEKILRAAIVTDRTPRARTNRYDASNLDGTAPGGPAAENMRMLGREGDIHLRHTFPATGQYTFKVRAYGEQAGPEVVKMALLIDDKEMHRFEVSAEENAPAIYSHKVDLEAGQHKVAVAYLNNYRNPRDPNPKQRDRNLVVDYIEIATPGDKPVELPESHRRIFTCNPIPGKERDCARQILQQFARRAFRRPVADADVQRLLKIWDAVAAEEKSFEKSIIPPLQAILVSPHFLFRGEFQSRPDDPKAVHPVDEYALASRLSYFLWSTMPDDELYALAEKKALRKNLDPQIRRMLKHPKANALVENFAGQWLQLRSLPQMTPAQETYKDWDEKLRSAMIKETEMFFAYIMRQDRSILDFLDADYTFANERLARHYGLEGVAGDEFQQVSLKGTPRGGILTHGSVLTVTSNPTRTSPVKRGKWVLENLLGTPPPPPPPDVPELKEDRKSKLTGSLRQRLEQHRADPNCAVCHDRLDPVGFGLENFDGIGAWREKDESFEIDPAGKFTTGEEFKGPADLKQILVSKKRDQFVRCISDRLLTYALGRGLEYYDKCALDKITANLVKKDYKFSALVTEIVKSAPFQLRRGEEQRFSDAR